MNELGRLGRLGRLGFTACSVALVGGVALSQGAEAASAPRAAVPHAVVFDDGEGDNDVDDNISKVKGKRNNVTANSPTKNLGAQHNSGNNTGRNINFQYGLCRHTRNCRISQKIIYNRPFVGFSGFVRERWSRKSTGYPSTIATMRVKRSKTTLAVKYR